MRDTGDEVEPGAMVPPHAAPREQGQGQNAQGFDPATYQLWRWRVQRAGWVVLALVVAVAGLGLFGNGPLSAAYVEGGPLHVDYSRFAHYQTATELELRVAALPAADTLELWLADDYLQHMEVMAISPPPREVRLSAGRHIYRFTVVPPGPLTLRFQLTPLRPGLIEARLGLSELAPVTFTQLIYP